MKNRKRPTKRQIKEYWKYRILELKKEIFNSIEYFQGGDFCFACGLLTNKTTERAHIVARVSGGSDDIDNIHLLCSACHKDSELIEGDEYFEWFASRSHVDTIMTVLYKTDYKLFKTFMSEAERLSVSIESMEFLRLFNDLRKLYFNLKQT